MGANTRRAAGFTLVEILIALSLATALTLTMFAAITPWINFRHKIETEHRLAELKDAVSTAYRNLAMQVDSQPTTTLGLAVDPASTTSLIPSLPPTVVPNSQTGGPSTYTCPTNSAANTLLAPYLSSITINGIQDGYAQNICIFVSEPQKQVVEGITLWYHIIGLVSMGQDGRLDSATPFSTSGVLTLAGDDVGVIVNGFQIQYDLYKETKKRLDRLADTYSSFFTARFQGNYARDYTLDYFVGCPSGSVTTVNSISTCALPYDYDVNLASLPTPTESTWVNVSTALASALGIGPEEESSAWESSNNFQVANQALNPAELVSFVQVQDPVIKNANLPPYTALLRTQLPSPSDLGVTYALKVVSGTY